MDSNFLQGLKEHEQKDHEWKYDLCKKQYVCIKELKEHEKEYHEWKCDRCKIQYVCIEELEEHLKKEHGIRNICLECGKGFENLEELLEHEYCYTCEQCENGYESREELEDHRRRKHIKNFYSSYDESADTGSYDDKLRIESEEELEEINTIEKQKVKEFELLEVSDKDAELVHEEGYDETINSNENIVAENNELIVEILLQEKTLTDNNIESERTNLECDKKTIVEQDKVDKIIEESLQDNCNVEIDAKYRKQDTNSEDTDKSQCSTETDKSFVKDRTEDSNRMFHENVPFHNLHNTTTESVNEDNLYVDPIAGDHIENLDENREETINGTEEEVLEKDDQNEDSSESYTVISGQSFHPEEVNIEVYDENQKVEFVT